jgi:hypothetical protein
MAALAVVIFSCDVRKSNRQVSIDPKFEEQEDTFYFYAIGDWGRRGQYGQKDLATTMGKAARIIEPEFIVSTGDNFYPDGVASVSDPAWKYSFEDVYFDHSLNCTWYVTLGNHDYRGSVQAQIDYSDVSRRWEMPDRYFFRDVTTENGKTARFLFVDTNPLNDEYYERDKYRNTVVDQDTTSQLIWIDSLLQAEVDYKIVVGHHPLYTGGKRVDDVNYVRNHLEPLFDKYEVDVYIAGHEHDLQHIKLENHPTHHLVSGAGSEVRPTGYLESTVFAKSIQGFLVVGLKAEGIDIQFVDLHGAIVHRYLIK